MPGRHGAGGIISADRMGFGHSPVEVGLFTSVVLVSSRKIVSRVCSQIEREQRGVLFASSVRVMCLKQAFTRRGKHLGQVEASVGRCC